MNVAETVGRALAAVGVDHVFGVVGSGNFCVTNAMVAAGSRFVGSRHEGGAATMAVAYARTSGKVAAVTVHQGGGLKNAMTGIAEAAKSPTPVLVLAGEVSEPRSNFYVDQDALARSVGAVHMRITSPEQPPPRCTGGTRCCSTFRFIRRHSRGPAGRRRRCLRRWPRSCQVTRNWPPWSRSWSAPNVPCSLPGEGLGARDAATCWWTLSTGVPDETGFCFPSTDFAAIARGYGFEAVTVREAADLKGVADWVSGNRSRPLLIDAKVVSDRGAWWLEEAFRGH